MKHIVRYIISFIVILGVLIYFDYSREGVLKWTENIVEAIILLVLIEFFSWIFNYIFSNKKA